MNKLEFNRHTLLNLTDIVKYKLLNLKWAFEFRAGYGMRKEKHRGVRKGLFPSKLVP